MREMGVVVPSVGDELDEPASLDAEPEEKPEEEEEDNDRHDDGDGERGSADASATSAAAECTIVRYGGTVRCRICELRPRDAPLDWTRRFVRNWSIRLVDDREVLGICNQSVRQQTHGVVASCPRQRGAVT